MDIQRQKNFLHTTEISSSKYVWKNHILKYTFIIPESFNIKLCNIHLNISGIKKNLAQIWYPNIINKHFRLKPPYTHKTNF